jgi:hypothetical protein
MSLPKFLILTAESALKKFKNTFKKMIGSSKDKLQEWTGHSTLISENLKIVEISKNNFNTI